MALAIAVLGATGYTGSFIVHELRQRGIRPVVVGRDQAKLAAAFSAGHVEARVAAIDDAAGLDRALAGVDAVINCVGPFLDTAQPVIEAALRARIHYFDLTAEQMSALATLDTFDQQARERGVVVAPAVGFYGALGDLLATTAMGDWPQADEIAVRIALDHWWPTNATRRTGARNTFPRLVLVDGVLTPLHPTPPAPWDFGAPFGTLDLVALPLTEVVLIARHLAVRAVHTSINEAPLRDLRDPSTPPPSAADASGRSSQQFTLDVTVRRGASERRAIAQGRDIYAVSAPLIVEAAERICNGEGATTGARPLGALLDAPSILRALTPEHLTLA
jgi:short subunit dehydrogenase-like uncharacterized protein